jgi:cysteinyl-tRNA synthetase
MIAGARVDVAPFKRDPMDFVLWKPSDAETPGWDSPWGRGRPGWHIECSAMSHELLGPAFDIHGGGIDLQFPHHENEIAQSRCAHPEDGFAKVWMHNEMLQVEGKKMSKSLGNFFTVRDLLDQGVPGEVIRFVLLGTHYSKPMDWTAEKARQAETVLRKISEFLGEDTLSNGWIATRYAKAPQEVVDALANDLNTSSALTLLATYLKNRQEVQLVGTLRLLGFDPSSLTRALAPFSFHAGDNGFASGYRLTTHGTEDSVYGSMLVELGNRLSELRAQALKTKDFSSVDALKSALVSAGVEVRMEKQGVSLVPGVGFDPSKLESLE